MKTLLFIIIGLLSIIIIEILPSSSFNWKMYNAEQQILNQHAQYIQDSTKRPCDKAIEDKWKTYNTEQQILNQHTQYIQDSTKRPCDREEKNIETKYCSHCGKEINSILTRF